MSTISQIDDVARRVLANLEEAGEDDACTLLNTIFRCTGADADLQRFIGALNRLFDLALVEFAIVRDETTLEWIVLRRDEALSKLSALGCQVKWSLAEKFWKWESVEPRLTVLLTPLGEKVSRQILEKFGWKMTEPI